MYWSTAYDCCPGGEGGDSTYISSYIFLAVRHQQEDLETNWWQTLAATDRLHYFTRWNLMPAMWLELLRWPAAAAAQFIFFFTLISELFTAILPNKHNHHSSTHLWTFLHQIHPHMYLLCAQVLLCLRSFTPVWECIKHLWMKEQIFSFLIFCHHVEPQQLTQRHTHSSARSQQCFCLMWPSDSLHFTTPADKRWADECQYFFIYSQKAGTAGKKFCVQQVCVCVPVTVESLPFFSLWQSSCPSAFCCVCCRLSLWQTSNAWPTVRTMRMAWLCGRADRHGGKCQKTFTFLHLH